MDILNDLLRKIPFFRKNAEKMFFNTKTQYLGMGGPVYLPYDVPENLYNTIPELHQVINKKADMFSNGCFELIRKSDNQKVDDKELFALLNKPNALQSQNKWLRQYSIQLDVYGNQFQYMNKTTSLKKYPASITNISSAYITPVLTGKIFDQTSMDGIVEKYDYKENGTIRTFQPNEIIWTKYDDIDNPVVGASTLRPLRYPLTNTKLAYDYLNSISGNKGAIGMVATSNKDSMGAMPLSAEDKQRLARDESESYGIGDDNKTRIKVVDGTVSWHPWSYPTRDLLLLEQISSNKLVIADHFGMNGNIFSNNAATYENVKHGLIQSYNDAVIPAADTMTQNLQSHLGISDEYELRLSYSHISILRPDAKTDADIITVQLANIKQAIELGLIDGIQASAMYQSLLKQ